MNFGDHRSALLLALEALPEKEKWNNWLFKPVNNWLFKPVTEEAKTVLASAVLRPLGSTLSGHDDPIRGVAFSPTEDVILTASEDKTAKLWRWNDDDGDWKPSHTPLEHDAAVNSARFSPDGTLILTGADNGWAYIWDARSGKKLTEWRVEKEGGRTIVDISPDNKRIATVVMGGNASIWDWDRREGPDPEGLYRPPKLLRPLIGEQNRTHAAGTNFIAFDRNGGRVVTTSWRGEARVWDVETGKRLHELAPAERNERGVCEENNPGHCDAVFFADFDPANPDRLVTASLDKTALIWQLRKGQREATVLHKLVGHDRGVTYAAFSKDGSRVITTALDGAVRLWDSETGETLQVLQGPATVAGFPASAALSPNEDYVVASFSNKWAHIWKIPEPPALSRILFLASQASHSTVGPASRRISVAGLAVDLYDRATSRHVEATRSFARGPVTASIAPGGSQIAVASGPCTKIYNIDGKSDNEVLDHVLSLRHQDGQVFRYEDGQAPDGKVEKAPCSGRQSLILSIAYDASGQRIATTSQDGTAKVWDAATGKLLAGPLRHDGGKQNAVFSGVFSRDGKHVLTGSFDGTVRVWNAEDGSEPPVKIEIGEPVLDAVYSDDGQHVVVETLQVPDKPVAESSFFKRPEDNLFKTTKAHWDIAPARLIKKLKIDEPEGRSTFRHNVTLPPGEAPDQFSTAVKEDLKLLPIGLPDIEEVVVTPGGKRLMTLSTDGSVRVWKWPPDDVYELVDYANEVADRQLEGNARKLSDVERQSMGLGQRALSFEERWLRATIRSIPRF